MTFEHDCVIMTNVMQNRRTAEDEDAEVIGLARRYSGLIHQFRLEQLNGRLAEAGPLRVARSDPGFSNDRPRLVLEDATVLRLKLYRPCRERLGIIWSVAWRNGLAWHVDVSTMSGERLTLRAYWATVD